MPSLDTATAQPANSRKRPGPAPNPNKLRFQSIGLTPDQRAYLRLWRQNPDDAPPAPGDAEDNPTQQLGLLLDYARRFWPEGNAFGAGWERDEGGRFAGKKVKK